MAERKATKRKGPGARKRAPPRRAAKAETELSAQIVDTALELAEEAGWDGLRLRKVAERLGVPLTDVLAHYCDLDAVANAWFRRGWTAMLAPPPRGFAARPARERLHVMMMRWFDALAPHREVTRQMLAAKLYPSHPPHWVPLISTLSRSIHWLREAALLDATGKRRQMEEVGLSVLFLMTLAVWLCDGSPHEERTRALLDRRLAEADRATVRVWGTAAPPGASGIA
jgi:AcrR family transcriptional regulator